MTGGYSDSDINGATEAYDRQRSLILGKDKCNYLYQNIVRILVLFLKEIITLIFT